MQIDFGEIGVTTVGAPVRVHFFVTILSYSRRICVRAFEHETHDAWFDDIEEAF